VAERKSTPQRITLKTTLVKAVELIASDYLRDISKKPVRWYYKLDPEAAKILMHIASQDANLGWRVLRNCDNLSLYGSQIPLAFVGYCLDSEEKFVYLVTTGNRDMVKWVDKQRRVN
jgi:hypothetical protein